MSCKKKGKKEKDVEEIIAKSKKDDKKEEKTLREIFGGAEEDSKVADMIDEGEKIEKEPSIINKDVFLKKYNQLDPDTPSGKENDSEKIKKSVRVSLTSKDED